MSGTRTLVHNLKDTILELIADLKDNIFDLEDEKGELMLVEFFFKRMNPESLMQHVISHIIPWKKKILNKDQQFFLENKKIFQGLPEDRLSYYGQIIAESKRLNEDDKTTIWSYFHTILEIAEAYKKNK